MGNRGYSGYYKDAYLKSSYEYVFAKILDSDNIEWEYEERVFDLGFKIYKPDFFIYDQNSNLSRVIEVKSEIKKEQKIALKSLSILKEKYNIDGELLTYKDLSVLCKDRGLRITNLINDWISNKNNTINKTMSGNLNPHYSLRHSDKSKKLIGERTRNRWSNDRETYIKASKKGALRAKELFTGQERKERVVVRCPVCGERFRKIESHDGIYCSRDCSNKVNAIKGANVVKEKAKDKRDEIKDYIYEWSKENKDLILETPYNKITNLKDLFNNINDKYGVKDMRIISKSVFGEDRGRKELLKHLKEYVQE